MILATIPLIIIASLAHNRYHKVALAAVIAITAICCTNAMGTLNGIIATTILAGTSIGLSKKNAHIYMLVTAMLVTAVNLTPKINKQITQGNKIITLGNLSPLEITQGN
jgi:hypothetical protein